MSTRRTLRRDTLYPHKRTIAFTDEQHARLCHQADRLECAVSALAREAMEVGLGLAVDRRRKRMARTNPGG